MDEQNNESAVIHVVNRGQSFLSDFSVDGQVGLFKFYF